MKLHEIVEGRLFQRGEFEGFTAERKMAELAARDIRYVVSLVGDPDPDLVGRVHYFHRAIPDGGRLEPGPLLGLARGLAILMRSTGGACLVHCHAGRNRSALLNALIVRELLDIDGIAATDIVRGARENSLANETFVAFLAGLRSPPPLPDKHVTYFIGQPGAGKSTLVAGITAGLEPVSVEARPFAHVVWPGGIAELGARREAFSGTDALSMSVQPKVVAWLAEEAPPLVLGEGDRLANGKFFGEIVEGVGAALTVVRISTSWVVAESRRASRAAALGSEPQSAAWVKGRASKNSKLAAQWAPWALEVNGDQSPERVLAELESYGDPVVALLRSAVRA